MHHSLGEEEGAVMDAPEAKGGSVEQRERVLLRLKCGTIYGHEPYMGMMEYITI